MCGLLKKILVKLTSLLDNHSYVYMNTNVIRVVIIYIYTIMCIVSASVSVQCALFSDLGLGQVHVEEFSI